MGVETAKADWERGLCSQGWSPLQETMQSNKT